MIIQKITEMARTTTDFRNVVVTGKNSQVVLMSLQPLEDIGLEVHENNDQIFIVVDGEGEAEIAGKSEYIEAEDLILVPAGTEHNIRNTQAGAQLKLLTIYAPPAHKQGVRHESKPPADD